MADLEQKKALLCDALKEKTTLYWELMKNWYKQKITKDDFDKKARNLLGDSGIHLHNDFLFSMLIKCHTASSHTHSGDHHLHHSGLGGPGSRSAITNEEKSSKKSKLDIVPVRNTTPYGVFNESRYLQHTETRAVMCGRDLDKILMCSHELLLPDQPTMHTRLLLIAWGCDMEGATEDAAAYMIKAIEMFLKSVLAACITCKTHKRIKSDGTNVPLKDTAESLFNCNNRTLAIEALEAQETASSTRSLHSTSSINSFDLRDTIKTYGAICIPSFPVRAMITEKIQGSMWHPSVNDFSNMDSITKWKQDLMK